jgi:hypothetical protein
MDWLKDAYKCSELAFQLEKDKEDGLSLFC